MSEDEKQEQDEQPEEFLNRAARRAAKHKKHSHGTTTAQGADQPHGRGGTVPTPRQYGNRRTG